MSFLRLPPPGFDGAAGVAGGITVRLLPGLWDFPRQLGVPARGHATSEGGEVLETITATPGGRLIPRLMDVYLRADRDTRRVNEERACIRWLLLQRRQAGPLPHSITRPRR